jgi:hypothetical protein
MVQKQPNAFLSWKFRILNVDKFTAKAATADKIEGFQKSMGRDANEQAPRALGDFQRCRDGYLCGSEDSSLA